MSRWAAFDTFFFEASLLDWKSRMVDPLSVADILTRLQNLGPVRKAPSADDLQGDFDGWFEGGAYREVTGYTTYAFLDGIEASIGVHPWLSVSIRFQDGTQVSVVEVR